MVKKMPISMPEKLKGDLEKMAEEIGLSQNHLAVLALHSLVKNYELKGTFIFVDLLNPEHRD